MRIAFTGPECSGKTELSSWLAASSMLTYVPEYARGYLESLNRPYTAEDLLLIAQGQFSAWNTENLVADTDILVILIWFEMKFGDAPKQLVDLVKTIPFDHYFLCKPDIPWVYDPLRENPHDRDRLFEMYLKYLQMFGLAFTVLEGDLEGRKQKIREVLNELGLNPPESE